MTDSAPINYATGTLRMQAPAASGEIADLIAKQNRKHGRPRKLEQVEELSRKGVPVPLTEGRSEDKDQPTAVPGSDSADFFYFRTKKYKKFLLRVEHFFLTIEVNMGVNFSSIWP
jgi:hypothetical protein